MSSLKVKRLKQETVGNKQEEAKPTWGRSPSSPSWRATLGPSWGGTPLPLAAPPTYKGRGRAPLSRHTSFLPSKPKP